MYPMMLLVLLPTRSTPQTWWQHNWSCTLSTLAECHESRQPASCSSSTSSGTKVTSVRLWQGDYKYKSGTTSVLTQSVKKFDIVNEHVQQMEVA
ncbi:hypothetical protein EB796_005226 [Bugula neritina]|uniref:Proteasome beta subunit C-terminal domain-containing protein n=1 Tax=Bugula neritina TaxID=10212 RepID=A0A7J7KDV2_BUGNE|nr:hypothetical protein EB796_005226 [Bugula neritina]